MPPEVLGPRALSRATLARQLLLARAPIAAVPAVAHLVGLQAQEPQDPYLALWSRLARFDPASLSTALVERTVVRTVGLRGTIHLVTADDCLALRPLAQPVLDGELARHPQHAPHLRGIDVGPALALGAALMAEEPRTGAELRAAFATRFPDLDAAALAYACRNHLNLVQVPPRGLWRQGGVVRTTTAEHWLGRAAGPPEAIEGLVLRYLAAFGPASVADAGTWSRLTGLRAVFDGLRPELRTFRDERGRELFDLPDAPRPDPATPAPVRFLPQYDNVLLSHADRGRFVDDDERRLLGRSPVVHGTVLHGGRVAATWQLRTATDGDPAALVVHHLPGIGPAGLRAIAAEGRRALRFRLGDDAGAVLMEALT